MFESHPSCLGRVAFALTTSCGSYSGSSGTARRHWKLKARCPRQAMGQEKYLAEFSLNLQLYWSGLPLCEVWVGHAIVESADKFGDSLQAATALPFLASTRSPSAKHLPCHAPQVRFYLCKACCNAPPPAVLSLFCFATSAKGSNSLGLPRYLQGKEPIPGPVLVGAKWWKSEQSSTRFVLGLHNTHLTRQCSVQVMLGPSN